ncbi:MAG: SCO family protein [Actinomycetota bacterium]
MTADRRPAPRWPAGPARLALAGALLAFLGLLAVGCAAGPAARVSAPANHGYRGTWLAEPFAKPTGAWVDSQGAPFDFTRDTTTAVTVVFFGYTHCPDECPTTMADLTAALRGVDPATRAKIAVVFVTTDPERDTPEVLRRWLAGFDPGFRGVTAPRPTLERAAAGLGIALGGRTDTPGGGYQVSHGTPLIGFGPDGGGRLVWSYGTSVADLRHDLRRLAAGGS